MMMQLDSSDIWLKISFENCICHRLGQKTLIRPLGLPPVRRSEQSYVCINFDKMECNFSLRIWKVSFSHSEISVIL